MLYVHKVLTRLIVGQFYLALILAISLPCFSYAHVTETNALVIANSKAWKPFSYLTEDGEPAGILIDYWKAYAEKNHVRIEFLLLDWDESLRAMKEGKAHVHAGLIYSKPRDEYLEFGAVIMPIDTQLYLSTELVGLNVQDALKGKTATRIGVVKGGYEEYFITNKYPDLAVSTYENNELLLKAAARQEIKLFIADEQVVNFHIATTSMLFSFVPVMHLYSRDLRIAAAEGSPVSIEALSHQFENIPHSEKDRIINRWTNIQRVYPMYLLPMAIVLFSAAAMFHIFNLRKTVRQKTKELTLANKKLLELTLTDPLTKLQNRRHFIEQLSSFGVSGRNLTLMIFDIDDFKSVNDRFGHICGDEVIHSVANTAKKMMPEEVSLARIGGEEFAIISSSLTEARARQLAEELCVAVAENTVVINEHVVSVSVSLGCAFYPYFDSPVSLADADTLMYRAKSAGKNRAVFQRVCRNNVEPLLRKAE
ncbi:transporter substrate-binding domain-containing diguanylate cyclase [Vibrio rotiferianus]|uniref:transporter substrate-binding domain-containing diguanylate cyclase n=1 Tax=Vibrio rotiferianus TaxID=190895 RepID=UPI00406A8A83